MNECEIIGIVLAVFIGTIIGAVLGLLHSQYDSFKPKR